MLAASRGAREDGHRAHRLACSMAKDINSLCIATSAQSSDFETFSRKRRCQPGEQLDSLHRPKVELRAKDANGVVRVHVERMSILHGGTGG